MPHPDQALIADYETAVVELEAIIGLMETASLPLADALQAYKRGAELLAFCQRSLSAAEQQVQILSENQQLNPFNPEESISS